ncbi:MAG: efflux RND transporter periplasmic adaptor subunit, partial [Rhizobacter sp.]
MNTPTERFMIRDTAAQDQPLTAPPAWRRRLPLALGGLVLAVGVVLAWPSLTRLLSAQGSVSASRLVLATVERGELVRDVAAEGRVVAAFAPVLYAPHAGTVEMKVHAGDAVRRGDVLAVVASPELASKLAQETSTAETLQADHRRAEVEARQRRSALQSTWEQARIDLTTAENDLARQRKAFDAGAVSGMQVDHAKDTLEKARIALAHAQSGVSLGDDGLKLDVQAKQLAVARQALLVADLKRQLDALAMRSPVDGQVGQLFVAERAQVAADAKLMSVIDLSVLEVQMQVPESFARELSVGLPGEVIGNGTTWKAKLSTVSPEVIDGQVAARLRFDGAAPPQLRQNQRLSVRVLIDRRDHVLTVRRGSFVDESGGAWAYRVRDDVAEKTPIRLGAMSAAKVEVLDGLQEGDRIVIAG